MKKLAIKGNESRYKEVIELLEMLGGSNIHNLSGNNSYVYYVNDHQNIIRGIEYIFGDKDMQFFTIEEFLEKYPFKVGDFVGISEYESEVRINAMKWDVYSETVLYMVHRVDEEEWYTAEELLDYNDVEDYKSCSENTNDTIDISAKTLGIKGHSSRSKDVKSLLTMLGGRIYMEDLPFDDDNFVLYIGNNKCVYPASVSSFNGIIYSLEEFEKKFPYKTGDLVKCWVKGQYGTFKIEQMYWYNLLGMTTVRYIIHNMHYYPEDLQPYEINPETAYYRDNSSADSERYAHDEHIGNAFQDGYEKCISDIQKKSDNVEFPLPEGFQFIDDKGEVINTTKIILERIKSKYPKTYDECCDKLDFKGGFRDIFLSENEYSLYTSFIKLIRCRDSYWKIAGEEMELGKPWKPDWSTEYEIKYVIEVYRNNVRTNSQGYSNTLLAFPTAEMRGAFYENFKDLIEQCKELL